MRRLTSKLYWIGKLFPDITLLSDNVFADVATPTPKRYLDEAPGYQWGQIIGVGLFVFACVSVVIWILLKFSSKRVSK